MYADGVCDVVDVGCSDVNWNDELLALVVQPLTQRVPTKEELHRHTTLLRVREIQLQAKGRAHNCRNEEWNFQLLTEVPVCI